MKKSLLFSLFVLIIFKLSAQSTLTSANTTPVVGEVFQNQYTVTTGVDTLSGGANQTWDFSGLSDSNASAVLQVVTPASTPYADSFPTSNLTIKAGNDSAYLYFNSQTSALNELGVVSPAGSNIKYTEPKVYLPYPFSYGNFYSSAVAEKASIYNVINNVQLSGRDSIYGDGYGTLKTRGNTYTNVLRVRYIENVTGTKDTTVPFNGFPIPAVITIKLRTISYLYFTPDTHAPLLTNEETDALFTGVAFGATVFDSSSTSKDISYLKNYILPLSFTSFKAQLNGKEVSLQWQTAQEINTGKFSVQRGLNGKDFSDIANVKASGNSSGAHYSYEDQDFVKTELPPVVYYRIKEIDKDGKAYYSTIANIHGNTSIINLYPNPVKNYINFNSKDASVADAITIFDAKGHIVQQLNNHSLTQPVDVSTFSKGSYFVQIKLKDKTINATIIKE